MANRSTNENKGLNKWIDGHQLDYTNTDFSTSKGENPPEPVVTITSASGGNIADAQPMTGSPNPNNPGGSWKYHIWQYPCPAPQSSFVVSAGTANVEYLVVGGGGGGQGSSGGGGGRGGGGGGGARTNVPGVTTQDGQDTPITAPVMPIGPGTYAVTIGTGGPRSNVHNTPAGRGNPSTIAFPSPVVADGGGGGFYPEGSPNEGPGGSGGANMNTGPTVVGFGNRDPSNNPTPHQGFPSGVGGGNAAAGGGGSGQYGGNAGTGPTGSGGYGGLGINVVIAPPSYGTPGPSPGRWFGGGGGGAKSWKQSGSGGAAGAGGGGAGAGSNNTGGGDATNHTGGGGGGGCGPNQVYGGWGGHGIVIVRYPA